jgi:hypothetical protein
MLQENVSLLIRFPVRTTVITQCPRHRFSLNLRSLSLLLYLSLSCFQIRTSVLPGPTGVAATPAASTRTAPTPAAVARTTPATDAPAGSGRPRRRRRRHRGTRLTPRSTTGTSSAREPGPCWGLRRGPSADRHNDNSRTQHMFHAQEIRSAAE